MTADVWLPLAEDEFDALPDVFTYRYWDGGDGEHIPDFPADPADCVCYVVPYMKGPKIAVRPLAGMSAVRVVQTLSAGIDHVEPGLGLLGPGVQLCNAAGVHEASTAELTVALTLASLRGIPAFVDNQRAGLWRKPAGFSTSITDKSVLIVGYGAIGAAVEDRLAAFELARVARIARSGRETARGPVLPLSELHRLLPEFDVVVLTTPLTEQTRGLVSTDFLARMKDGALLVNVSRGPVVDTGALLEALNSGRITAALDVTDPEPLPDGHPLWHAPGVLISPHTGGATSAFMPRAKKLIVAQLEALAAGVPLRNVVLTTGG